MKIKLPHIHLWSYSYRVHVTTGHAWRIRECRCGRIQRKNTSGIEDCRWKDIHEPFAINFHKYWFDKAIDFNHLREILERL